MAQQPQQKDWSILEVLQWTTARFSERSLPSPRLDAELLVAHAMACKRIDLYVKFDQLLTPEQLGALRALIQRRQAGEPVAYLTGRKEFWSLDLSVDARVLVPRPDTETAMEEALERLPQGPARVLDVGTGSGALALALAKSRPEATVFATDASPDALAVAQSNGERLGLTVTFLQGDLMTSATEHGPFDLIVANLPYIPTGELAALAPEVRAEPVMALDGGPDGLDVIRRLVTSAPAALNPGGWLVLELGAGQAPAVAALCERAGLHDVHARKDLSGIERVVAGRKQVQS